MREIVLMNSITYLVAFLFFIPQTYANTPLCGSLVEVENIVCLTSIDNIHPTQFVLGMVSIEEKVKKFKKKYRKKKLHKKLAKKILPSALGPDNKIYIMDGHHSSYALLKSDIPERKKNLFINIIKDCSKCSLNEFEEYMTKDGHSYLYNKNFEPMSFYELPSSLTELTDNPYRGFAWLLREEGCFEKVDVNFLEFIWARALKRELNKLGVYLDNADEETLKSYMNLGCEISKLDQFNNFPGYVKKK